jgi:membrane protease YdiL (CAAX protease family)
MEMRGNGQEAICALLAQNLLFVAVAAWYWRRQRWSAAQIGVERPTGRQLVLWLAFGIGVFATAFLCGAALERLFALLLSPPQFARLEQQSRQVSAEGGFLALGRSLWARMAFVIMGAVAAPIGEEALFRGVIYRAMRRRFGIPAGIIGSSLLFAIVHVSPLAICVIFVIGLLLACAYERTGSLWAPILMHGVNNALMFALLWHQAG